MSLEKICQGLCRAEGTGQCAPLCLTHASIHTTGGMCPERTKIWRQRATEVAYALGHGEWIDPVVPISETGIVVTLTSGELTSRSVLNPRSKEYISALLVLQAVAPLEMFQVSTAQYAMMRAKARRLLGRE